MRVQLKESWMPKNWCFWTVILEKTLESPLDCNEIQPVHPTGNRKSVLNILWKDWCWSWNSNDLAIWWEELAHLKRLWCWERLKAGGEGDERGWDCWIASLTEWTWVWLNSGSWWWTGWPGVLQSMGLQRVRHDWAAELKWNEANVKKRYQASKQKILTYIQHFVQLSFCIKWIQITLCLKNYWFTFLCIKQWFVKIIW